MKADADIFVVTGTTAVGKTETALRWAEEHDAEIVSCDSTNVYRGMDVGTAKPTREERARVPHHGIDLVSPREKFSVADYLAFAVPCVRALAARGKKILVAGGSGFYLKAFYAPVVDGIDVPESVRARVAALVAAGAVALSALARKNIRIGTHIASCGGVRDREFADLEKDIAALSTADFAVLDPEAAKKMQEAILAAKNSLDSVGGVLETAVTGMPAGVGEPYFDSMESLLAHMLFSIPAVKGVEFGSGFGFGGNIFAHGLAGLVQGNFD